MQSQFAERFLSLDLLPIEEYRSIAKKQRKLLQVESFLEEVTKSKELYENQKFFELISNISRDPTYLIKNENDAKNIIEDFVFKNEKIKKLFDEILELDAVDFAKLWVDYLSNRINELSELKDVLKKEVEEKEVYNVALLIYFDVLIKFLLKILSSLKKIHEELNKKYKHYAQIPRAKDCTRKLYPVAVSFLYVSYSLYPLLAYVMGQEDYYEALLDRLAVMLESIHVPPSKFRERYRTMLSVVS